MGWTDEQVEELKRLWNDGLSTGEIGKTLGLSKNAVVGKAHRLGLVSRPSPIRRGEGTPAEPEVKPAKQPADKKKAPEPAEKKKVVKAAKPAVKKVEHLLTINDLTHDSCRFPIGDPKDPDFHFCGKKVALDRPYCPEHCELAYVSTKTVR